MNELFPQVILRINLFAPLYTTHLNKVVVALRVGLEMLFIKPVDEIKVVRDHHIKIYA